MESVIDQTAEQETQAAERVWRERALTKDEVFHAVDEAGRTGWFLRVRVTGMHPRRIGPFDSKEEALDVLEDVIAENTMGALCDIQNGLEASQACVIENVPTLAAIAGD